MERFRGGDGSAKSKITQKLSVHLRQVWVYRLGQKWTLLYILSRESPLKHSQLQILPPPSPTKKKKCRRPAGLLWGGVGGGVIAIPNPRDKRPVGKKKAIPFFQVI